MAKKRMKRGGNIDFKRVTKMYFRLFEYLDTGSRLEIALKDGMLEIRQGWKESPESTFAITPETMDKLTYLFSECGFSRWKCYYKPVGYMVYDGEGWELKLEFNDGLVFKSEGSNAWPEQFDELKEGIVALFD